MMGLREREVGLEVGHRISIGVAEDTCPAEAGPSLTRNIRNIANLLKSIY